MIQSLLAAFPAKLLSEHPLLVKVALAVVSITVILCSLYLWIVPNKLMVRTSLLPSCVGLRKSTDDRCG
jgi:hypothetical protein